MSWITDIVNAISQGRFNHDEATSKELTVMRGLALRKSKTDPTAVRPIAIGVIFMNMATGVTARRHRAQFMNIAGPHQMGAGVPSGISAAGKIMQAGLIINPGSGVGWEDATNAFNSLHKVKMLEASAKVPGTEPIAALRFGRDAGITYSYRDGVSNEVNNIDITQTIGGAQGDSLTGLLYVAATGPIITEAIATSGASLNARADVIDDLGWIAPVADLISASNAVSAALLGVGVQNSPLHIYKPGGPSDAERAALDDIGAVIMDDGVVYAGTPIGEDSFLKDWAVNRVNIIINNFDAVEKMASAGDAFIAQALAHYSRLCLLPMANWVLTQVPPRISIPEAERLDDAIFASVLRMSGAATAYAAASGPMQARARAIFSLPPSLGGLGFTSTASLANSAYIGSWARELSLVVGAGTGLGIPKPVPGAPPPAFLDEYVKALNDVRVLLPASVTEGLNPSDIWDAPKYDVQKEISEAFHNLHYNNLKLSAGGGDASLSGRLALNAIIGGKCDEGGGWVTANPRNALCRMSDAVFQHAVIARLLLPQLPTGACAHCAGHVDALGGHALVCKGTQGSRTKGHTIANVAVQAIAREGDNIVYNEPWCRDYWERKEGEEGAAAAGTLKKRADAGIKSKTALAGPVRLVDVTITATTKTAVPTVAYLRAGDAAALAETNKVSEYDPWVIPTGSFIPFAIESTGALGNAAKKFLHSIAASSGPPKYASLRYRRYCEIVSVALQSMLAPQTFKQRAVGVLPAPAPPAAGAG